MNTYRTVLALHIASAMLLVGGSLAGVLVRAAARRAATQGALAVALALGRPVAVLNPASALVLLGSGAFLASAGHWWSQAWVQVALALWVVNLTLAKAVAGRAVGRLAARIDGSQAAVPPGADEIRNSRAWSVSGDLLVAHDLAAVVLMTLRPDLLPSLVVVATAVATVIGVEAVRVARRLRSVAWRIRVGMAE